jgi:hypothetical protein
MICRIIVSPEQDMKPHYEKQQYGQHVIDHNIKEIQVVEGPGGNQQQNVIK